MSRKKLKKFAQARQMPNIFLKDRVGDKEKIQKILQSCQKIYLELAAGRGDYTLFLAKKDKEALCLAIDFRSDRLLWGAKKAIEDNLSNALFLRERVEELPNYLKEKSVDKIWLPFPDPFPKDRHEKHRLTNPSYLKIYKKICKKSAPIYFKTDDKGLFKYTLDSLKKVKAKIILLSKDLFTDFADKKEDPEIEEFLLSTRYQQEALEAGKKIFFIKFTL